MRSEIAAVESTRDLRLFKNFIAASFAADLFVNVSIEIKDNFCIK